jgi:hypothetical protein
MWDCTTQPLDAGRAERVAVRRDGSPAAYRDVLRAWRADDAFRSWFVPLLASASRRPDIPGRIHPPASRTTPTIYARPPRLDAPNGVSPRRAMTRAARPRPNRGDKTERPAPNAPIA